MTCRADGAGNPSLLSRARTGPELSRRIPNGCEVEFKFGAFIVGEHTHCEGAIGRKAESGDAVQVEADVRGRVWKVLCRKNTAGVSGEVQPQR